MLLVQVILETSRLATVVNGVLRKTTQDVELNGMLTQQTYNFIYDIVFEVKVWPHRKLHACVGAKP
jgi:brassinosteroid-6-oxidase 1